MNTLNDTLIQLAAIQTYSRLPLGKDGTPYHANYFKRHKAEFTQALKNPNGKVITRLWQPMTCIICGESLPENTVGDHVIPRSKGGKDGIENRVPLCKTCNYGAGGKHTRDLFEWLRSRQYNFSKISPDLMIVYARLRYQHATENELQENAPTYLIQAVDQIARATLTPACCDAVLGLRIECLPPQPQKTPQITLLNAPVYEIDKKIAELVFREFESQHARNKDVEK
jgi:5-methylcytosine-specific restriction endonuclease McrA